MDLSAISDLININELITNLMHIFDMFYSIMEKIMGKSFDDLEGETEGE